MMWHNDGVGWGGFGWGGWAVMVVMMVAFWGLLIVGVIAVWRASTRDTGSLRSERSYGPSGGAEAVLAERFARGEIDAEEYQTRRAVLRSGR